MGMVKQGTRWDKYYDACALQGARRKKQCIRHDVEEIHHWPNMRCRHTHHPQEWTPTVDIDGDDGDGAEHMETQARPRKMPPVSFLRQPGKGAEVEEEKAGKTRFIHHLEQQTTTCESGFEGNISAAEAPTLQRATITAGRIVKYMASREKSTEIGSLEPLQLDHFPNKLQSQAQAVNAASRMEGNQAPTTQPDMLQALEERLVAAAEKDDQAWLAATTTGLQLMGDLRFNQVIRRSAPVELFSGWILFFCKRGKQQHNRSGFYWGVPRKTTSDYAWTARFLADWRGLGSPIPVFKR